MARASSTAFLDMTPCSWVGRYQHFRGTRIRHPGRRVFTQHVSTNHCYQSTKQRRVDIPDGGNLSAIYFKGNISKVQSSATLLQARSFHFPAECLVSSACFKCSNCKTLLSLRNPLLFRGALKLNSEKKIIDYCDFRNTWSIYHTALCDFLHSRYVCNIQ